MDYSAKNLSEYVTVEHTILIYLIYVLIFVQKLLPMAPISCITHLLSAVCSVPFPTCISNDPPTPLYPCYNSCVDAISDVSTLVENRAEQRVETNAIDGL